MISETPIVKRGLNVFPTPSFKKEVVQDGWCDGHWVEAFLFDPSDKCPSILAHCLQSGDITFFYNPENEPIDEYKDGHGVINGHHISEGTTEARKPAPQDQNSRWKRYTIGVFDAVYAVTTADVTGNGRMDVIVCCDLGASAYPEGNIVWLENPGKKDFVPGKPWTQRFIGKWPAMDRIAAGYFTQSSVLEIIGAPLAEPANDRLLTPVPLLMWTRPAKIFDAVEWPKTVIDDENFLLIHDIAKHKFHSKSQRGRESILQVSQQGLNWVNFTHRPPQWNIDLIGESEPRRPRRLYAGEGCAAMGSAPGDVAAYFMTTGSARGGVIRAYIKSVDDPSSITWISHVLDYYGTPEQQMEGTGPCSHVVTGDFDGDGVDEALVTLFGPEAGVYYYKPVDLVNGIFAKWKVADVSVGKIAVADFTGSGTLDFATVGYTPGLTEPKIHIYYNQFAKPPPADPQVLSTIWAGEPLLFLPRPENLTGVQVVPLMEIGGYKITLELASPKSLPAGVLYGTAAIRMLWGEIKDGETVHSVMNVPAKTTKSARIYGRILYPGSKGAAFIRFTSLVDDTTRATWKQNNQVPVKTLFTPSYEAIQLPDDTLVFKQYDKTEPKRDFYNLTGFHFRFADNGTNLCHMQFWTAGKDVNCGVHNHSTDIFCELHMSLFTGTGNGGMWIVKDGVEVDPNNPNGTSDPNDFDILPLKTLEQHGRLWRTDSRGKPLRRENMSVDYPWHKWQAGNLEDGQDIWVAFEYNPDLTY